MRNLDSSVPSSFRDCEPDDIDLVNEIDELKPIYGPSIAQYKVGLETWSCDFSSDCSFFAWSCGDKFVRLIPWDRLEGRLCKKARQYSAGNTHDGSIRMILDEVDLILNQSEEEEKTFEESRKIFVLDCKEYVWSVAFGFGRSKHDLNSQWKRLKLDYNNSILATGLQSGRIKLWECFTGNLILELVDHKDIVRGISFAPDGSLLLVSASRDGTIKLWDLNDDGNMYKTLRSGAKWNNCCKWSHDCKFIANVGSNKTVVLWNMEDTRYPKYLKGHHHDVLECDFSPDSSLLATASYDTKIIIWDPYTADVLLELCHLNPPPRPIFAGGANDHFVRGLSFNSNGLQLCSVADDGYLRVWNLEDTDNPQYIAEHQNPLCCAFTRHNNRISVGNREGGVKFYAVPPSIPGLQHLCRMTIRLRVRPKTIDHLGLPIRLKEYLKYHDL